MIENKLIAALKRLPEQFRTKDIKKMFVMMIEDRAYKFVAKKVAKLNGDIRVAFDMIKTAFSMLAFDISNSEAEVEHDKVKVTLETILRIFEQKYGSKIAEMLKNQPNSNILVLNAAVELFLNEGDHEKYVPISKLHLKVLRECDRACADRMTF